MNDKEESQGRSWGEAKKGGPTTPDRRGTVHIELVVLKDITTGTTVISTMT